MSLQMRPLKPVPEQTQRIARSAFPKGNVYILLRNQLGTIFTNEDFVDLYPTHGQPAWTPWRLALVTLLQFRENLSDRQAADAVRSRIDWKYLLGLELDDPGFNFSVLSEFRGRLVAGACEMILLDKLLERCRELEVIKPRGKQRTDATYILGAVRVLTRLEQIGESMRAALNEIATTAPVWLQGWVPLDWYDRYGRRVEQQRLPKSKTKQQQYAQTVGQDIDLLLQQIQQSEDHQWLLNLPKIIHLQVVFNRQFDRKNNEISYKSKQAVSKLTPDAESPYDPEVRYCKRGEQSWVGYQAHLTETCNDDLPHLVTVVATTSANEHEVSQTRPTHQRLEAVDLVPSQHLVDSAYISAEILQQAQQDGIQIIGPPRLDTSWQARTEGAFDYTAFAIDWDKQRVRCPNGHYSVYWYDIYDREKRPPAVRVRFRKEDCLACSIRERCTRSQGARQLRLPSRPLFEALEAARTYISSEEGAKLYKKRAGIEGTISQAVRAFGFRRSRYIGQAKTHLQHVATAAALNLDRLAAWFFGVDRAKTRVSAFAALAPT